MKWAFAAADPKTPRYLICNADEGEPGTFKDKPIMELNPHLMIEGMAIAAHAIGCEVGYVYLRGEYPEAFQICERAIAEAEAAGYIGPDMRGTGKPFRLHLHRGAGAYICGEETALIESLEGRRGQPRVKPPFPVNEGYMGKPTVVNNVETFANLPMIFTMGAEAYSMIGTPGSPGPKLFAVSGAVEEPGVYEAPMGITIRELIYDLAGGIRGGKALKGVIPGGVSTPILTPAHLDCKLDFVNVPVCGSMLGSGAVIVFDEDTCMVSVALRTAYFFEHESCGKCTPCREGCGWLRNVLHRIEHGQGHARDLDMLMDIADNMTGKCFCALGEGAADAARHFLTRYRAEFEAHIKNAACTILPPPKD
jgi:NADH-quinone oxidoreductase subunit F